jgi:F420-dependent oxidoreductase-like protein
MKIAILLGTPSGRSTAVADLIEQARQAEQDGFAGGWFANILGMDAMIAAALCGPATSRMELGTAVVPTYSRHPLAMAQQALTAQAATQGRFTLGIGPSHKPFIEDIMGLSFARPLAHTREYVEVLTALIQHNKVAFEGSEFRVKADINVPGASPCPILIAGLGEKMLALAGSATDGTITAWTGPKTLEEHIIPRIREAAAQAGRPAPRIMANLPIGVVTDDVAGARARIARGAQMYSTLPSYRAMLDREGVGGPADVAILGDADDVAAQVQHLAAIGVTDLIWAPVAVGADPAATVATTRALLLQLQAKGV